jgi:hypothetical protein
VYRSAVVREWLARHKAQIEVSYLGSEHGSAFCALNEKAH